MVVVAGVQPCRLGIANLISHLDGGVSVFQAESVAVEDVPVTFGVQVGKTSAEFDFFSIYREGTERAFAGDFDGFRNSIVIDAQKPPDPGPFEFEHTCCPIVGVQVYDAGFHVSENPVQDVEKVNADVGGDSARFLLTAFPTGVVPVASRRNIGDVDVEYFVFRRVIHLFFQRNQRWVQTQLQDGADFFPAFVFHVGQRIHIPRIQYERLLANYMGADAQAETDVGVVQIVGRTNGHIVDVGAFPDQFVHVAVEALEFCKKSRFGEVFVNNPHIVIFIQRCYQTVSRILDGFHVSGRDVACRAQENEVFHLLIRNSIGVLFKISHS